MSPCMWGKQNFRNKNKKTAFRNVFVGGYCRKATKLTSSYKGRERDRKKSKTRNIRKVPEPSYHYRSPSKGWRARVGGVRQITGGAGEPDGPVYYRRKRGASSCLVAFT